jgi:HNH endonuclease
MAENRIPERLRAEVSRTAGHRCEYCRIPESYSPIPRHSVDHIVPACDGGETVAENLALSCQGCNNFKSTRREMLNSMTGESVRLFHPRKDRWRDHFAWSRDALTVEGLTKIGRATVEVLQLNREGLVNIRRALVLVGVHPPPEDE